ncbi:hypothetical protein DFJ77DRAFT_75742 [Powellomyces hirtus]|nr:hypothetical protein DFJ77DRAFT_75742 [Powellomyces hirtus]
MSTRSLGARLTDLITKHDQQQDRRRSAITDPADMSAQSTTTGEKNRDTLHVSTFKERPDAPVRNDSLWTLAQMPGAFPKSPPTNMPKHHVPSVAEPAECRRSEVPDQHRGNHLSALHRQELHLNDPQKVSDSRLSPLHRQELHLQESQKVDNFGAPHSQEFKPLELETGGFGLDGENWLAGSRASESVFQNSKKDGAFVVPASAAPHGSAPVMKSKIPLPTDTRSNVPASVPAYSTGVPAPVRVESHWGPSASLQTQAPPAIISALHSTPHREPGSSSHRNSNPSSNDTLKKNSSGKLAAKFDALLQGFRRPSQPEEGHALSAQNTQFTRGENASDRSTREVANGPRGNPDFVLVSEELEAKMNAYLQDARAHGGDSDTSIAPDDAADCRTGDAEPRSFGKLEKRLEALMQGKRAQHVAHDPSRTPVPSTVNEQDVIVTKPPRVALEDHKPQGDFVPLPGTLKSEFNALAAPREHPTLRADDRAPATASYDSKKVPQATSQEFAPLPAKLKEDFSSILHKTGPSHRVLTASEHEGTTITEKKPAPAVAIGQRHEEHNFAPLPQKLEKDFDTALNAKVTTHSDAFNDRTPTVAARQRQDEQVFTSLPVQLEKDFDLLVHTKAPPSQEVSSTQVGSEHKEHHTDTKPVATPAVAIGERLEGQHFTPLPPKLVQLFDTLLHSKTESHGVKTENDIRAARPDHQSAGKMKSEPTVAIGYRQEGQHFAPLPPKLEKDFDALLHPKAESHRVTVDNEKSGKFDHESSGKTKKEPVVAIGHRREEQHFTPLPAKLEKEFNTLLHPQAESHGVTVDKEKSGKFDHESSGNTKQEPVVAIGHRREEQHFTPLPAKLEKEFNTLLHPKTESHGVAFGNEKASGESDYHTTIKAKSEPVVAVGQHQEGQQFAPLPSKLEEKFDALLRSRTPSPRASSETEPPSSSTKNEKAAPIVAIGDQDGQQGFAPVPSKLKKRFESVLHERTPIRGASSGATTATLVKEPQASPAAAIGESARSQKFAPLPPQLESNFDVLLHAKTPAHGIAPAESGTQGDLSSIGTHQNPRSGPAVAIGDLQERQMFVSVPSHLENKFDSLINAEKLSSNVSPELAKPSNNTTVAISDRREDQSFAALPSSLENRFNDLMKSTPVACETTRPQAGKRASEPTSAPADEARKFAPLPAVLENEFKSLSETSSRFPEMEIPVPREKTPIQEHDIYSYYADASPDRSEVVRPSASPARPTANVDVEKWRRTDVPAATPLPEHIAAISRSTDTSPPNRGHHAGVLRDRSEEHSYTRSDGKVQPTEAVPMGSNRSSVRSDAFPPVKNTPPRRKSPPLESDAAREANRKSLESKFEDMLARVSQSTQHISPYPAGSSGRRSLDATPTRVDDAYVFTESDATLEAEYRKLMQASSSPLRGPAKADHVSTEEEKEASSPPALKTRKSFTFGLLSHKRRSQDSSRSGNSAGSPGRGSSQRASLVSGSESLAHGKGHRDGSGSVTSVPSSHRSSKLSGAEEAHDGTLGAKFDTLMKRLRHGSGEKNTLSEDQSGSRRSGEVKELAQFWPTSAPVKPADEHEGNASGNGAQPKHKGSAAMEAKFTNLLNMGKPTVPHPASEAKPLAQDTHKAVHRASMGEDVGRMSAALGGQFDEHVASSKRDALSAHDVPMIPPPTGSVMEPEMHILPVKSEPKIRIIPVDSSKEEPETHNLPVQLTKKEPEMHILTSVSRKNEPEMHILPVQSPSNESEIQLLPPRDNHLGTAMNVNKGRSQGKSRTADNTSSRNADLQEKFDNLLKIGRKSADHRRKSEDRDRPWMSQSSTSVDGDEASGYVAPPLSSKSAGWLRKSFDGFARNKNKNVDHADLSPFAKKKPRGSMSTDRAPTHISSSGAVVYDEEYRARKSMERSQAAEDESNLAWAHASPPPLPANSVKPKLNRVMRAKKSLSDLMSMFKSGSSHSGDGTREGPSESSSLTRSSRKIRKAKSVGADLGTSITASAPSSPARSPLPQASCVTDDDDSANDNENVYVPHPSPLPSAWPLALSSDVDYDEKDTSRNRDVISSRNPVPSAGLKPAILFTALNEYGMPEHARQNVSRSQSPDGEEEVRIQVEEDKRAMR